MDQSSIRAARIAKARQDLAAAVSEAHSMHIDGDVDGARDRLFSAGLGEEGIAHYLSEWGNPYK